MPRAGKEVPIRSQLPADLVSLPAAEVRRLRAEAITTEAGVSYLRRLVQGRLDILLAESHRREIGDPPDDVPHLIQRLPVILTGHASGPGRGRPVPWVTSTDVEPELQDRIQRIVSPHELVNLAGIDDQRFAGIIAGLVEVEHELSVRRKALHQLIDTLGEEIGRRYSSGEMSADGAVWLGVAAEAKEVREVRDAQEAQEVREAKEAEPAE
jgi:hypothetical protein